MKKRIYLILASLTLLLFSSCDAILDMAYPPKVNNSINISLDVDPNVSNSNDYITLAIIPMNNGLIDVNNMTIFKVWRNEHIDFTFDNLDANAYRVFAFQDLNNDEKPNWDEPSTELNNYSSSSEPGLFDFRYTDSDTEYWADGYLGNYAGIGFNWLDKLNENEDYGNYQDTGFYISGPENLEYNYNGMDYYYINQNDTTITITNYLVHFYDQYNNEVIIGNFFDYDYKKLAVDFGSVNFYDGDSIRVELELTIDLNGNFVKVNSSFVTSFYDSNAWEDPGFYIGGPTYMDRWSSYNSIQNFWVVPNEKEFSYLEWRITDNSGNTDEYNGNEGYIYEQYSSFYIDFNNLYYLLNNDGWWSGYDLKLIIKVHYTDGTFYEDTLLVDLSD